MRPRYREEMNAAPLRKNLQAHDAGVIQGKCLRWPALRQGHARCGRWQVRAVDSHAAASGGPPLPQAIAGSFLRSTCVGVYHWPITRPPGLTIRTMFAMKACFIGGGTCANMPTTASKESSSPNVVASPVSNRSTSSDMPFAFAKARDLATPAAEMSTPTVRKPCSASHTALRPSPEASSTIRAPSGTRSLTPDDAASQRLGA